MKRHFCIVQVKNVRRAFRLSIIPFLLVFFLSHSYFSNRRIKRAGFNNKKIILLFQKNVFFFKYVLAFNNLVFKDFIVFYRVATGTRKNGKTGTASYFSLNVGIFYYDLRATRVQPQRN